MNRTISAGVAACALALAVAAPAAAAPAHDDDTVIVKWRPGVPLAERLALQDAAGVGRTLDTIHGIRAKVVQVAGDPAQVAAALDRSPLVEYAEVNRVVRLAERPNDARFGEMWALENIGQATQITARNSSKGTPDADIEAPEAWAAAGLQSFPDSGGATVAVIDTGVQDVHEDLAGKVIGCATSQLALAYVAGSALHDSACADEDGHGTHVAGTIAARANNGAGIAGVAFNSPLIACKALHGHAGLDSDVANCIAWAHDRGAKVISMSLTNGFSQTQQDAARYAWEDGGPGGSVLVAAAGNYGTTTLQYPAGLAEVISVAATDNRDRHVQFSQYNADVEVSAPGMDILSTNYGTYTLRSGTSMAAPHVAGAAALIWTLNPGFTAAQVRAKLATSVDDLGPAGRDHEFGFGRLDLLKAVTP